MAFTHYVNSKPSTQSLGTAIGVAVCGDENGFELHIQTDEGSYVVNVHACSEQLLSEVEREIGEYWAEAQSAMAGAKIFACNPDESGGYDRDDPKHPDWHSVHADLWDSMKRGDVHAVGKRLKP